MPHHQSLVYYRVAAREICLICAISCMSNIISFTIPCCNTLTHWGWEMHICVDNLTIIGSDNGLSPQRRQAIIGTNVGILLFGTLGKNFSEILIKMHIFSFKKMHLKVSSGKWRPFCLGLNVLRPEQNGCHFTDNLQPIFLLNKNVCIFIETSQAITCTNVGQLSWYNVTSLSHKVTYLWITSGVLAPLL